MTEYPAGAPVDALTTSDHPDPHRVLARRRRLRVAHVLPPLFNPYSGIFTVLPHLCSALAQRGHHVELWQFDPPPEDSLPLFEMMKDAGVQLVPFASPGRYGLAFGRFRAFANSSTCDFVHLHGVFQAFNTRLTRELQVPYVLTPHGGYAPGTMSYHAWRKRAYLRLFELRMLERAAVICALSDSEAADLRRLGVRNHVAVIPNGISPVSAVAPGRARARREGEPLLAVYVGRLDIRQKRLDALVRGVAVTSRWRLELIGGPFRKDVARLEKLIASLDATDRITFVPPARGAELSEHLHRADVFVLLSRSEGHPMALLEAAEHGVCTIVSPEVERVTGIAASGGGWVCDPEQLPELLSQLAALPYEERARREQLAREFARAFRWPRVAELHEQMYLKALAHHGSGSS